MLQEFIDFVMKNNIIGLAIGLLVATKVGDMVKSVVEDLLTPAIFAPTMKRLKIEKLNDLARRGILYGKAIARLIDFLVTAFIVFLIIKYFSINPIK
ncbi:MscL family protein [Patescibacteria group bacterium]|nr:MscL family protein [Patescibacteria group bacterium]